MILSKFNTSNLFDYFLSNKIKVKSEKIIVYVAIISFILHLVLISLVNIGILDFQNATKLLNNPISAIYTPFSFILIYEVYLLVYYLPKSTTIYIGKQYEIISLIIIRRIFKDLSNLEFTKNWFQNKYDLIFMCDLAAIIILFLLIYYFYKLNDENELARKKEFELQPEIISFIKLKKIIATILVPIFLLLAVYSLTNWLTESFESIGQFVYNLKDINKIFFDDFFTILILVDVLLLLFSFLHSDNFSKVIRNSGFIISTILLKLSFGTEGILNSFLIVCAVLFGVIILKIHNLYEKRTAFKNNL
jgi:uncharacterized membrane protein (DUF373 family)